MRSFKSIIYLCVSVMILCASAATALAQDASAATAPAQDCVMPLAIEAVSRNIGDQVTLKPSDPIGNGGWHGAIDLPGGSGGADEYRDSIEICNNPLLQLGNTLIPELGNMVGPTKQGMEGLIALDRQAYWDEVNQCPVSSVSPSPRVKAIPLYDPERYATTGEVRLTAFTFFFVEAVMGGGKEVVGRVTTRDRTCLVTEPNGETTCDDGRDNDGDGAPDCQDDDCSASPNCVR